MHRRGSHTLLVVKVSWSLEIEGHFRFIAPLIVRMHELPRMIHG